MKISKITIKSLFGIKEWSGDGKNIELVGDNGTGKTSVIDAIRYALTNASDREYIIKNGETEGEIFIETDSGLSIDRKERSLVSISLTESVTQFLTEISVSFRLITRERSSCARDIRAILFRTFTQR